MEEPPDHGDIERDLKGIGARLRNLHDELANRRPVLPESDDDAGEVATGDAVEMNPLTPPEDDAS